MLSSKNTHMCRLALPATAGSFVCFFVYLSVSMSATCLLELIRLSVVSYVYLFACLFQSEGKCSRHRVRVCGTFNWFFLFLLWRSCFKLRLHPLALECQDGGLGRASTKVEIKVGFASGQPCTYLNRENKFDIPTILTNHTNHTNHTDHTDHTGQINQADHTCFLFTFTFLKYIISFGWESLFMLFKINSVRTFTDIFYLNWHESTQIGNFPQQWGDIFPTNKYKGSKRCLV